MSIPFDEFDRCLREADKAWNVAVLGQVVFEMMRMDPGISFITVEKRLRETASRTYLLAAPLDQRPEGTVVHRPDGVEPKYWIWMELHGETEAVKVRASFGCPTVEENLVRLGTTGFLGV